jgi:hypothetical protein
MSEVAHENLKMLKLFTVLNLFTFEAKTVRDFGIVMGRT